MEFKLTHAQALQTALPLGTPGVLVAGQPTCAAHHNSRTLLRAMGIVVNTRKGLLNRKSGYDSYLEAAASGVVVRFTQQAVSKVPVAGLELRDAMAVFATEAGVTCPCYQNILVIPLTTRGIVLPGESPVLTSMGRPLKNQLFFVTGAFNSPLASLNNVRPGAQLNFFRDGVEHFGRVVGRNHMSVTVEGGITVTETDLADIPVFVIGAKA